MGRGPALLFRGNLAVPSDWLRPSKSGSDSLDSEIQELRRATWRGEPTTRALVRANGAGRGCNGTGSSSWCRGGAAAPRPPEATPDVSTHQLLRIWSIEVQQAVSGPCTCCRCALRARSCLRLNQGDALNTPRAIRGPATRRHSTLLTAVCVCGAACVHVLTGKCVTVRSRAWQNAHHGRGRWTAPRGGPCRGVRSRADRSPAPILPAYCSGERLVAASRRLRGHGCGGGRCSPPRPLAGRGSGPPTRRAGHLARSTAPRPTVATRSARLNSSGRLEARFERRLRRVRVRGWRGWTGGWVWDARGAG